MESVLKDMITRYQCVTDEDYHNALKEIIQDIALLGLWRIKFFEHAAFYGGTALRILYGLDRFSEDLDFILLSQDQTFSFAAYQGSLEKELASFGLTVTVAEKKKTKESCIRSAFLKANTKEHILKVGAPKGVVESFQLEELTKIKIEIDIDPCTSYVSETHDLIRPIPFFVRTLSLPSLFAGKLHAVLCRGWGKRIKGRDWFDMLWFVQREVPVRIEFLEEKMRQTGHYSDESPLDRDKLINLLNARIDDLDIDRAKEDVVRFLQNSHRIDGWTLGIFRKAVDLIKFDISI
jgi:predicted nucleotidyltransferase component of viral defense system